MQNTLILGATGSIGFSIARLFLDKGDHVVLHGSSLKSFKKINLSEYDNSQFTFLPLHSQEIESFNGTYNKLLSKIDVLINACGGGGEHQDWEETSIEKWKDVYLANVVMPVFFIKKVLPYMKKRGFGRIVNISSVSATKTLEIGPEYSSAKAGLIKLSESLAKDCKDSGVNVNCVSPGLVNTEYLQNKILKKPLHSTVCDVNLDDAINNFFPNLTGKIPVPNEIAELVLFLTSSKANAITGQNLIIDSGYSLSNYATI
jgi:NAD(P)-dependent dehydrogenase (short-subunit alcohol dehydrogenase family)